MSARRESNHFYNSGDESDGDIPNEFSDNEDFNSQGAESHHFAPRASVSSQGSRRDPTQVVNRQESPTKEFSSPGGAPAEFEEGGQESYSPSPGGESSVVEEIVGEKIVNLKSDDGEKKSSEKDKEFNQNYLNVDKAEYINKEEYGSDL